jgi:hypothetical protein
VESSTWRRALRSVEKMTSVIYQEFQEQYQLQRQEKDEFTNLSEDGKKTRIYNHIAFVLHYHTENYGSEPYPIDPDDLMTLSLKIARGERRHYTYTEIGVIEMFYTFYDDNITDQKEEIKYIYDVCCEYYMSQSSYRNF